MTRCLYSPSTRGSGNIQTHSCMLQQHSGSRILEPLSKWRGGQVHSWGVAAERTKASGVENLSGCRDEA
eukprot:scaffold308769_cov20-Tisochrysis_lutea.AAC.3